MFASAGSALVAVPDGDELAEGRVHGRGVAVGRLRAAEDVAVVEQVEALQPQQDRLPWLGLTRPSTNSADVLRARAAERRLADDRAVDDRAVVVGAVAVVVDAGRRR